MYTRSTPPTGIIYTGPVNPPARNSSTALSASFKSSSVEITNFKYAVPYCSYSATTSGQIASDHDSPEHGSLALTENVISLSQDSAFHSPRYCLNPSLNFWVPLVSNVISFNPRILGWLNKSGYCFCHPSNGSPPVITRCSSRHSLCGSVSTIASAIASVVSKGDRCLNLGSQLA